MTPVRSTPRWLSRLSSLLLILALISAFVVPAMAQEGVVTSNPGDAKPASCSAFTEAEQQEFDSLTAKKDAATWEGADLLRYDALAQQLNCYSAQFAAPVQAGQPKGATRETPTVTATVGTGGTYLTLKAAFDDISGGLGGLTGAIQLDVVGDTTETATAVLNASGSGAASYTSVLIQPTGGAARTIGGSIAGDALVTLNGADNVTIDGLNTGGNALALSNTSTAVTSGTSTLKFITDATSNTVTNVAILGSSTMAPTTNGGNIWFAAGAVTTGNDNNVISNSNIGPAGTNLPTKAIYANGSTTSTTVYNSGNLITGNNIYDYFNAAAASHGVYFAGGNTAWTISNNKFYQTATRTQTTGAIHAAIQVASSLGNDGHTISGNTIGYASAAGTGTYTIVFPVSTSSKFYGILYSSAGTTATSSIQGNTITAINVSGGASGTSTTAAFGAILIGSGGAFNIGNVTGNVIGSLATPGAISYSSSSTSSSEVYGVYHFPSTAVNIGTGTELTLLSDWQTTTGKDANSISANPLFNSTTNLQPQTGSPLLSAGVSGTGITTDITGASRGTPPTIGAYENTTVLPAGCAVSPNPADLATGVSVTSNLSWAAGGGGAPTGYKLYFGTDTPPTNLVNGTDLGLVTTYNPTPDPAYTTTHYWQIVPYNTLGSASGCPIWSFTTEANPNYGSSGGYNFANSTPGAAGSPYGQPTYNWITEQTNDVTTWTTGDPDDGYVTVDLTPYLGGAGFPFFSTNQTQVYIASNGFVAFGTAPSNTSYGQNPFPNTATPNNLIAGAWMDLDLRTASNPDVHLYYGGDASKFVITYWHARRWTASPPSPNYVTFQIILYPDGKIVTQYSETESFGTTVGSPSIQSDAIIGIEDSAGALGIGYRVDGVGGPMFGSPMALAMAPIGVPLAVDLASFAAEAQANQVLVTWETVSEVNNAGFNLYRSSSADGTDRALLAFVPSQSPGSTAGASYSVTDAAVTVGQTT